MTEERHPAETGLRNVPKNLQPYFLGLLRKGSRWNETDGREAVELLPQHLAYLREQIEKGRYVVAGPVTDESDFVGMMIVKAASLEDALALANQDPGVLAGRMRVEIHPMLLPALDDLRVNY
ncbi:MAG: YciI family protein [Acidobacteriaceae bacterium]